MSAGFILASMKKLCCVEQSIIFISDYWRLFPLKTLDFVHHSSVKETGLDLWHKRFGNFSNDSILRTVGHLHGMNNFPRTIPSGTNCPDYIIGNFRCKESLAERVQKTKNLIELADCDLMTVNEFSLEEYRHAVILTDSISDLIWEN